MEYSQGLLSNEKKIRHKIYLGHIQSQLVLLHDRIVIGSKSIALKDAIGLVKEELLSSQKSHAYTIYSYPKRKKIMRKEKRYIQSIQFQVQQLNDWQQKRISIISLITNRYENQTLKLLICFNPNAGSNSEKHLLNILEFISMTNLQPQVFTTQYRNHCLQHLKQVDPEKYCGVAIVSGDGLMHQYVNSFCQIPVTHVPAGSGNAFAKTQMEIAGEACSDFESIFLVIKNKTKQFNIIKYELQKLQTPIYSFLGLEWAIIADLDMNSEFLRCLGGFRFQIYAAWRCIMMKRYRGKISYSTTKKQLPALQIPILQNEEDIKIIDGTFLHTIFCSIPYLSDKYKIAPTLEVQDKKLDIQLIHQESGRFQLIKYLLSSDSGSHFDLQHNIPAQGYQFVHKRVKCFRLEPLNPQQMGILGIDGEAYESQKIQASFSDKTFKAFV